MLPVIIRAVALAGTRARTAKKVAVSTKAATQSKKSVDTARGIQNAEARFQERSHNRLTSTQLRGKLSQNAHVNNDRPIRNQITSRFEGNHSGNLKNTYRNIQKLFRDGGQEITDSEVRELSELKTKSIDTPPFPYFIFCIALLKDVIDVVATLIIVGIPFAFALSFLMALVLFFWVMGKMSGGWWKKRLIRSILVRYGIMVAIEFIPGVSIVPTTTIFILMAHFREEKLVKLLNRGLEQMHSAGIK